MATETDPSSLEELTETLAECGSTRKSVELGGHFSKRAMGGVIASFDVVLSTSRMSRVLIYEPNDLAISLGAGITYQKQRAVLAGHRGGAPPGPRESGEGDTRVGVQFFGDDRPGKCRIVDYQYFNGVYSVAHPFSPKPWRLETAACGGFIL